MTTDEQNDPDLLNERMQEKSLSNRSTRDVFDDHLRLRKEGKLEEDISRNYAKSLVLLHKWGVEHGYDGLRKSAKRLRQQLPNAIFRYKDTQVAGEYAYLEWEADSERSRIRDGADTFVIRDGLILMQSIHYRLLDEDGNSVLDGL